MKKFEIVMRLRKQSDLSENIQMKKTNIEQMNESFHTSLLSNTSIPTNMKTNDSAFGLEFHFPNQKSTLIQNSQNLSLSHHTLPPSSSSSSSSSNSFNIEIIKIGFFPSNNQRATTTTTTSTTSTNQSDKETNCSSPISLDFHIAIPFLQTIPRQFESPS
jgi:hypothetical protein